jgi:hypothetical protein
VMLNTIPFTNYGFMMRKLKWSILHSTRIPWKGKWWNSFMLQLKRRFKYGYILWEMNSIALFKSGVFRRCNLVWTKACWATHWSFRFWNPFVGVGKELCKTCSLKIIRPKTPWESTIVWKDHQGIEGPNEGSFCNFTT